MNKWLKYTLAACMAALCSTSLAQAESSIYTGAGLGLFEMDPGQNKKSAIGGNLFLGAEFGPLLAVEGRLGSSQSVTSLGETSKVDWLASLLAKPKYDIAGNINIYALAGVTIMKASFTPRLGKQQSKTTTGLSYGLGAEIYLNYNTLLGLEWVRYATKADAGVKNSNFKGLDVNAFLASLQVKF
ncbi:MAG: porin family protein [Mariprofundaceae bacterium]|nr:porin family protein [Mariprofundaceae bacterium]